MTTGAEPDQSNADRTPVEQAILRLFLRKGELEWDEQHPLFDSGLTIPQMKVLFTAARPGGARPGFIAAFLDHLVDWDFAAKNLAG